MRFISLLFTISLCLFSLAHAVVFNEYNQENNLKIWHSYSDYVPTVEMRIVFPLGSKLDPIGKEGLATLAAATLDEGAGEYESTKFRDLLDKYNISLSFSASRHYLTLSLSFMNFDADYAAYLTSLALTKPRFDEDSIELMKKQIITMLESNKSDPETILSKSAKKIFYGDTPYSAPTTGTIASISKITRSDLQDFSHKLSKENVFVSVVGDMEIDGAKKFLKNALGELPIKTQFSNLTETRFQKNVLTQKMHYQFNVPQTQVQYQTQGIYRDDPNFIAYYVASNILGGSGLNSRLMSVIREKYGLTYGIYSGLNYDKYVARFVINYATDNEKLKKSIELTNKVIKEISENGFTEKEFKDAISYLKGTYLISYNTNNDLANLAMGLWQDEQTPDYAIKRQKILDNLTLEQVNIAAKKLLSQKFEIIMVGKNAPDKETKMIDKQSILF